MKSHKEHNGLKRLAARKNVPAYRTADKHEHLKKQRAFYTLRVTEELNVVLTHVQYTHSFDTQFKLTLYLPLTHRTIFSLIVQV